MKRIGLIEFCGKPLIYTNLVPTNYSYKWDACIQYNSRRYSYNS